MASLRTVQEETFETADYVVETLRARDLEPRDALMLLRYGVERAQLGHALGADAGTTLERLALASGAGAAAALVALRIADPALGGTVFLAEPGAAPKAVPHAATGFALDDWVLAFCASVIANDAPAARLIATSEVIDAATPPRDVIAPAWADHCAALAAAAVAPGALGDFIAAARASQDTEGDGGVRHARLAPTLALLDAYAGRDGAAFAAALEEAVRRHAAFYAERDMAHIGLAVWPLEASALSALAAREGWLGDAPLPSAIPAALFGAPAPPLSTARVVWQAGTIQSADEAHWFLDLRGVPRAGRSHELRDGAHGLTAHYRFSGPLVPQGEAAFRLADRAEPGEAALDPAELLTVAQLYASVDPQVADVRAGAAEAVRAVDAVIERVPDGADRVPREALTSALGEALLHEEPGRLRLARLLAYRNALARSADLPARDDPHVDAGRSGPSGDRAQTVPAPPSPAAPPSAAPTPAAPTPAAPTPAAPIPAQSPVAEDAAMAAAAVIEARVRPLIEALAGEDGPAEVARLTPTARDFAEAFLPDAAAEARSGYARAFPDPPEVDPPSGPFTTRIDVAAAGLLLTDNTLSQRFPSGMRSIAPYLVPHRVWVGWRYLLLGAEDDAAGDRYDGLVYLDDRWVFFPKPWRYLSRQ